MSLIKKIQKFHRYARDNKYDAAIYFLDRIVDRELRYLVVSRYLIAMSLVEAISKDKQKVVDSFRSKDFNWIEKRDELINEGERNSLWEYSRELEISLRAVPPRKLYGNFIDKYNAIKSGEDLDSNSHL